MFSAFDIQKNYEEISNQLHKENNSHVDIIAVTKGHPPEIIKICKEVGINHLAENRAQEVRDKKDLITNSKLKLHYIGNVQSKNLKYLQNALYSFDTLHDIKTAENLNDLTEKNLNVLLQVNSSAEPQKSGLELKEEILLEFIEGLKPFTNLTVQGLMTMGPTPDGLSEQTWRAKTELCFSETAKVLERLRKHYEMPRLSMGMSNDYQIAVACQATEVRLGSILFGNRMV